MSALLLLPVWIQVFAALLGARGSARSQQTDAAYKGLKRILYSMLPIGADKDHGNAHWLQKGAKTLLQSPAIQYKIKAE